MTQSWARWPRLMRQVTSRRPIPGQRTAGHDSARIRECEPPRDARAGRPRGAAGPALSSEQHPCGRHQDRQPRPRSRHQGRPRGRRLRRDQPQAGLAAGSGRDSSFTSNMAGSKPPAISCFSHSSSSYSEMHLADIIDRPSSTLCSCTAIGNDRSARFSRTAEESSHLFRLRYTPRPPGLAVRSVRSPTAAPRLGLARRLRGQTG